MDLETLKEFLEDERWQNLSVREFVERVKAEDMWDDEFTEPFPLFADQAVKDAEEEEI